MAKLILAVNTGSTSTKLGIFEGYNEIVRKTIHHKRGDLEGFEKVIDQKGFRLKYICDFLLNKQINPGDIDAVVGRGGLLRPIPGGTYRVNKQMIKELENQRVEEHASNLGGLLAKSLADMA